MYNFIFLSLLVLITSCSTQISQRKPSSGNTSCHRLIKRIYSQTNNYTNNISIHPHSHGARTPGFENKIKSIFSYVPSVKKFVREYESLNNRLPKNSEILNYLIESNKKVISELGTLKTAKADTNQVLKRIQKGISYNEKQLSKINQFKENESAFLSRTYNPQTKDDKNKFRSLKKEFYGTLGEVDIFMKLEGTHGVGIYFRDHLEELSPKEAQHNRALFQAVDQAENRLRNISEDVFENMKQRYPLIFDREGQNIEEKVERVISWMRSKEIDIVANINNENYLVEVKNYVSVIDKNTLTRSHGGKSILTQQKELIELIQFLDLDYKPMIVFRRGVTSEASEILQNLGFEVLGE